jgi:hypothetical protein
MFRVRWAKRALDQLADLWNRAAPPDRRAITQASHEAEQRLRRNAPSEGESRPRGRRILFVPPLAVTFRVEPDGQTVSVLGVGPSRPRRP